MCWVAARTRNPVLHARALDLAVALLHAHLLATRPHLDEEEGGEGEGERGMQRRQEGDAAPSAAAPASPCAWHLVQAGLLDLVRLVLQQAVQQVRRGHLA